MNQDFINKLKENVNIVDIIGQYVPLTRSGGNYKACCPFHKENTPSFMVNDDKQFFKCFGCSKSGDVISFIQEIEHLDFSNSIKFLADKAGFQLPTDGYSPVNPNLKKIKDINLDAARFFYRNLLRNNQAIAYLRQRNIKPETIKSFGLGYADDTRFLLDSLLEKYDEEILIESGLANKDKGSLKAVFRNRIIFPIFNIRDEIIGFGGRNLGEYGPKYLNSKETLVYHKKESLYALNIAKKHVQNGDIFLVEGYMDVISLHQNDYPNTIATLGTALTLEQAKLISRYASLVYILYDSDSAGRKATLKALDILLETGIDARVILLGEINDPDDFFKQKTKTDFENLVTNSKNYLSFNIYEIEKKYDLNTNLGKEHYIRDAVNFIKEYQKNKFARQTLIEDIIIEMAEKSGFSIKSIGVDIFGQYFSPKQFEKYQPKPDTKIFELDIDIKEIEKKERLILKGLSENLVSFDKIGIVDFINNKNKLLYYQIKNNNEILLELDGEDLLSEDEYSLLIKNLKNLKLDIRIKHLEKVQEKHLDLATKKDMEIALILANYIMKLKKQKY